MYSFELRSLANRVAEDYLKNGVPVNDGIAKVARANRLNANHIQRLVEESNHAVNDALRKTAKDKRYVFPLASSESVLGNLGGKIAVAESNHVSALSASQVLESLISNDRNKFDKLAEALKPPPDTLIEQARARSAAALLSKVADRVAAAQRETQSEWLGAVEALGESLKSLKEIVKQGELTKTASMNDIFKFALVKTAHPEFWKLTYSQFVSENFVKLAQPVDPALIALSPQDLLEHFPRSGVIPPTPEVQIVNGSAAMTWWVDSIDNEVTELQRLADRKRDLSNFHNYITSGYKLILNNDDVYVPRYPECERLEQYTRTPTGMTAVLNKFAAAQNEDAALDGDWLNRPEPKGVVNRVRRGLGDAVATMVAPHHPGQVINRATPVAIKGF